MRAQVLLVVVTTTWCALASAADTNERTYADPACSERDAKPEKCVLQDGPPRRVVAGTRNAIAGEAGAANANANAAPAGSTGATATGQAGPSTIGAGRK
ncbi:MAG TPA: hypothetical protein VGC70_04520 [Burkholderiales bacterium]